MDSQWMQDQREYGQAATDSAAIEAPVCRGLTPLQIALQAEQVLRQGIRDDIARIAALRAERGAK